MKRFILVLFIILLSFQIVSAHAMKQINATFDISDKDIVDVSVSFKFTEQIKEIIFPCSGNVVNLEVMNGKCRIEDGIKTNIVCNPPSPFMAGDTTIHTKFKSNNIVQTKGNISYFYFDVPVLWDTGDIFIKVKLPVGMAMIDDKNLPISPSGIDVGSDGRRIVLKWNFKSQKPGDIIPVRVYYEKLGFIPGIIKNFGWLLLVAGITIFGIIFLYSKKYLKRTEMVLSILNEQEKILVNIIKNSKKNIDQRKLVAISGFSKAKVSRIVKSLEERGVILVQRLGRKNKIKLKKKFIKR